MNLRGRVVWGLIDVLSPAELTSLGRPNATVLGSNASATGKSWRGAPIRAEKIAQTVESNGGEICEISGGGGTPMAWCCGGKRVDAEALTAASKRRCS